MTDFFERVAALRREGQAFAVATVVARRAPVSAHVGDRAIVFADGRMEGFVGGACSREIVRQQARDSLQARQGRLVSIRPDAASSESTAEHVAVSMTCASEGAIDVYIEPFVRARSLFVVGATPVADAVARLARAMEYEVVRVVDAREQRDLESDATALGMRIETLDSLETLLREDRGDISAVVASQGHYDEEALESILKTGARYVGLVASRQRGATLRALLEESGATGAAAIRIPAGLDLGARTAPEVALSILAEIVQMHPTAARTSISEAAADVRPAVPPASTIDPVCGMRVDVANARHAATLDGVEYSFCCANCRARFVEDPQAFLQPRP